MRALLLQADAILRGGTAARPPVTREATLRHVLTLGVLCGAAYGLVMGSFGGFGGDRPWQIAFSAAKVPLLLLVTFLLSLPSFFVLNTLLGVRRDFGNVLRALVGAQAGLSIVLAALAPYTAFLYACGTAYQTAILYNGGAFAIASFAGQWLLRRSYAALIDRNPRHRLLLRLWLALYVFVGIQMAWVLRPFVGDPSRAPQFLRPEAWGNAYVVVARMVWRALAQ